MKLLLVESGATKTVWQLLNSGKVVSWVQTAGFNPFHNSIFELETVLKENVIPSLSGLLPDKIYFYGAGCSTKTNCAMVENAFKSFFNQADVSVMPDIMGAAHALLGNKAGIACVLGTGTNVCVFDGTEIVFQVPSLGYVFADEGSGAYIGKMFLKSYLYGEVPDSLAEKFNADGLKNRDVILNKVYKEPKASAYLAQTARFVGENLDHPFCMQLITNAFDAFIEQYLFRVPDFKSYSIGFTGSVAWHLQAIMKEKLQALGLVDVHFVEDPSVELATYHKKKFE